MEPWMTRYSAEGEMRDGVVADLDGIMPQSCTM